MRIYQAERNGIQGWIVDWSGNGVRTRKFFKAKSVAQTYASTTKMDIFKHGQMFARMKEWERVAMVAAYRRAEAGGYTLREACEFYEKAKPAQ